jgi:photosystem II stability/assembly factor-like uncharacterized protein
MRAFRFIPLIAVTAFAIGQSNPPAAPPVWQMQSSGTTAGLRGIDSVDGTVAWASGTGGTVLKTLDGGAHWTVCAIPDAAKDGATLDFRGVQAFDAKTAIVMSSGKGKLSRLYKTKNGCKTWKLIFMNPDKDGFWDAAFFDSYGWGRLLGDPVKGRFTLFFSEDKGNIWTRQISKGLRVQPEMQGAFAASNSSLISQGLFAAFGSGGPSGTYIYMTNEGMICLDECTPELDGRKNTWERYSIPIAQGSTSTGVYSIGERQYMENSYKYMKLYLAVGGDFTRPNDSIGTAAWSSDGGEHWTASTTPPHGFRSAVQWSEALKAWITVGTNGSNISRDDGKTWQPLDNGNWNALSLPFVVGPNGRIARLNPAALPAAK